MIYNKTGQNLQNIACVTEGRLGRNIAKPWSLIISFFSVNSRSREVHEITYMTQDLKVSREMITPSS